MDLKGCTVKRALNDSRRLHVWYNEERDHGMERVRYAGRVTHFLPSLGLRVWFDGYSASEQEWVNEGDEWEWEEPIEPVDAAPLPNEPLQPQQAMEPVHADSALSLPAVKYHAVRLRIRSERGDSVQTVRLPADPLNGSVSAVRSSLSLSAHESSPRKFGKKARLLKCIEEQQSADGGIVGLEASQAEPSADAGPHTLMPPAASVGTAKSQLSIGAVSRSSALTGKRSGPGESAVRGAQCTSAQVERGRPAKQTKQAKQAPPATLKLRVGAGGVQLLVPAVAKGSLDGLFTRVTSPEPPLSEAQKYGLCPLSGLPARYHDPLTGQRYGSLDAFKSLRVEHTPAVTASK
eukprot:CAMPEP_0183351444 /NCGR_PEP_ID=MMETSP0164_2-20130417/24937_1 /TAXON_ID=221442 /ORGANISM="Coccolithus pelagicus ssp braarudi, Strain PLY182g" /LENGTH=347 /DNA_ID=CAMNT_0025523631 /DNA_START=106 /DNA_END=1149 /DNA_ORIENTATION=-